MGGRTWPGHGRPPGLRGVPGYGPGPHAGWPASRTGQTAQQPWLLAGACGAHGGARLGMHGPRGRGAGVWPKAGEDDEHDVHGGARREKENEVRESIKRTWIR